MSSEPITFYNLLSLIVSIVSSIAVVVSLTLVYRQTRIFAKQAEYLAHSLSASVAESMIERSHEISRLFIQYPTLRPYFYEGQPIDETHPDYHRAEAIAELLLDIFWAMRVMAERYSSVAELRERDDAEDLWGNYVQEAFALSPILVNTVTKRRNWYGQELVDDMNEGLRQAAAKAEQSASSQPQPDQLGVTA